MWRKHTLVGKKLEVIPGEHDANLWLSLVRRHRTVPFWRVPRTAEQLAVQRKSGVISASRDVASNIETKDEEEGDVDVEFGRQVH